MKSPLLVFLLIVVTEMCDADLLAGGRILPRQPQRIHHGHLSQEPIPVPLPLPAKPGYIIIPKASHIHSNGPPPQTQDSGKRPIGVPFLSKLPPNGNGPRTQSQQIIHGAQSQQIIHGAQSQQIIHGAQSQQIIHGAQETTVLDHHVQLPNHIHAQVPEYKKQQSFSYQRPAEHDSHVAASSQPLPGRTHGQSLQNHVINQHQIHFQEFAEPEPQGQEASLYSAPDHGPQNLIPQNLIPPRQEPKQSDNLLDSKNHRDYDLHLPEESAPHAVFGHVLSPGDVGYQTEINAFPGLPDIPEKDPWPLPMPEMPKISRLDVKCEKNLMKVVIDFDKPFHGIIYSKGHYSYGRCVHLPAGSGHNNVYFDISINSCGMQGSSAAGIYGPTETGSFFENTVVVQYDPLVQEAWDQARKLRCNWHDQYEKTVTFRPFPVDMLNVVRADFAGDNVGCWMQIQVGKGPWASEVSGIVRIGQTMTLVLAIKDEQGKFDMVVRNCIAHDGNKAPIELVDGIGCITRPKLMSRFTKVKNFGSSASILSYAHFQAFKFPDSTDVHIQCTVQICRNQCPEQCSSHREKRDTATDTTKEIGLNRVMQVVAAGDLIFSPYNNESEPLRVAHDTHLDRRSGVCMSASGLAATLILLLSVVVISCLLAAFLYLKQRALSDLPALPYDLAVFKRGNKIPVPQRKKH